MGGAHVLELPARTGYDPAFYMRVTSTLYLCFGVIGGALQVLALLASAVLAWRLRGQRAFRSAGWILLLNGVVAEATRAMD